MKLEKTSESITRVYTDGEAKDTINNVAYGIRDDENRPLGELNVFNGGSYTISMSGATTSIEEAVAEVKKLLNITE